MKKQAFIVAVALILGGVLLRVLPHPANFAPITAIALFGGAVLPKKFGIFIPLAAMMISDAIIGFHALIPVTWGCYVLIALASQRYLHKVTASRVALLSLGSSLFFFVVTNFAVWLTSGMYALSWAGLAQCYTLALPFFRNTFTSDLLYSFVLFGAYALATYLASHPIRAEGSRQI